VRELSAEGEATPRGRRRNVQCASRSACSGKIYLETKALRIGAPSDFAWRPYRMAYPINCRPVDAENARRPLDPDFAKYLARCSDTKAHCDGLQRVGRSRQVTGSQRRLIFVQFGRHWCRVHGRWQPNDRRLRYGGLGIRVIDDFQGRNYGLNVSHAHCRRIKFNFRTA